MNRGHGSLEVLVERQRVRGPVTPASLAPSASWNPSRGAASRSPRCPRWQASAPTESTCHEAPASPRAPANAIESHGLVDERVDAGAAELARGGLAEDLSPPPGPSACLPCDARSARRSCRSGVGAQTRRPSSRRRLPASSIAAESIWSVERLRASSTVVIGACSACAGQGCAKNGLRSMAHAECTKDTDCKGDRVCNAGVCERDLHPQRRRLLRPLSRPRSHRRSCRTHGASWKRKNLAPLGHHVVVGDDDAPRVRARTLSRDSSPSSLGGRLDRVRVGEQLVEELLPSSVVGRSPAGRRT